MRVVIIFCINQRACKEMRATITTRSLMDRLMYFFVSKRLLEMKGTYFLVRENVSLSHQLCQVETPSASSSVFFRRMSRFDHVVSSFQKPYEYFVF